LKSPCAADRDPECHDAGACVQLTGQRVSVAKPSVCGGEKGASGYQHRNGISDEKQLQNCRRALERGLEHGTAGKQRQELERIRRRQHHGAIDSQWQHPVGGDQLAGDETGQSVLIPVAEAVSLQAFDAVAHQQPASSDEHRHLDHHVPDHALLDEAAPRWYG
jgi:hypothetical protein